MAQFLPPRLIPPSLFINPWNHQTILIDVREAFVDGMNIPAGHQVIKGDGSSIRDGREALNVCFAAA